MKMNKKGFTLIEMLVVIAIIAVLVSIIIPVVGNSNAKAQAATDAANLRSAKATLTIAVLNGTLPKAADGATATYGPSDYPKHVTGDSAATEPKAPVCKSGNDAFKYTVDDQGNVTVYFGTNTIETYANKAS
jgi:prepilin-type N-terminal cleavage/methylation domain-containing protein